MQLSKKTLSPLFSRRSPNAATCATELRARLADELRRWLADEVVLAAETGPLGLMMRYFRKNKMVGLLVAAVILSVAVGALVSFSFALQSREAADRARIQAARANQKSASSSLELNNPADAVLRLEEIPAELRGWEARHVSARMANFEIYSSCGSEVLCVAPIAATNELLVGITGGFLEIVDLDHVRPTEVIDLRPMYGSTAGGSVMEPPPRPIAQRFFCTRPRVGCSRSTARVHR